MTRAMLAAACAALLLAGCGDGDAPAAGAEGVVVFVPQPDVRGRVTGVDGEGRLVLEDGRRVTLAGVDLGPGAGACAGRSLEYLGELSVGRSVAVDACATGAAPGAGQGPMEGSDVTGLVAVTDDDGEAFVNVELLRAGLAQLDGDPLSACGEAAAQARLEQAEAEAQAAGRGVFGDTPAACEATPPEPQPIAGPRGRDGGEPPALPGIPTVPDGTDETPGTPTTPVAPVSPDTPAAPVTPPSDVAQPPGGAESPIRAPAPVTGPQPVTGPTPIAGPGPIRAPSPVMPPPAITQPPPRPSPAPTPGDGTAAPVTAGTGGTGTSGSGTTGSGGAGFQAAPPGGLR